VDARLPDALRTPSGERYEQSRKSMPEKLAVAPGNALECIVQAGETPGGKPTQVRRTRGVASLQQGDAPPETRLGQIMRGAATDSSRLNGHGPGALEGSRAASDGANGTSAAMAATSAAAGTDRQAHAEVAGSQSAGSEEAAANGAGPRPSGEGNKKGNRKKFPPGIEELPADGIGFVDEMHARVDFWEVGKKLLHSKDEKIMQRAWERLLEMKYGKGPGAVAEEAPQIIVDIPRPIRD
jgi:hypothetical protein